MLTGRDFGVIRGGTPKNPQIPLYQRQIFCIFGTKKDSIGGYPSKKTQKVALLAIFRGTPQKPPFFDIFWNPDQD